MIFIDNKYTKCYNSIIAAARARTLSPNVYIEKHHIIPKSMGGNNSKDNIAKLTAREHFVCHLLLSKMTTGTAKGKMVHAAWCLCNKNRGYKITSTIYESIKTQRAAVMSLTKGPSHPNYGRKTGRTTESFTTEWKENIAAACKGRVPWNVGVTHTAKTRKKLSESRKAKSGDPTWNIRPACRPEKAELIRKANTGKKWVHNPANPVERKQLNPNDCLPYLQIGWVYGIGQQTRK